MGYFIEKITLTIFYYYIGLFLWNFSTLILSFQEIFRMKRESLYQKQTNFMQKSELPITIMIPAYNEEKRIVNCIYSALQSHYPHIQIIVVNDESTDNTLQLLMDEFQLKKIPPSFQKTIKTCAVRQHYQSALFSNLMVIDKEHSPYHNPADNHNVAINATCTPLVMTLDADTVLEPDALDQIIYHFVSKKHCISVGGAVFVANDNPIKHGRMQSKLISDTLVSGFQSIEYIRSFTFGRTSHNPISGSLCYPGAFTVFETNAVREFGGFNQKNCSFDAEIIINFHHQMRKKKYPTTVQFCANSVAWTIAPNNLKSYWRQRSMWQRGMLLSVWNHKIMLFNPKYGVVGLITFPAYLIFEILAPVVEGLSYMVFIVSYLLGYMSLHQLGWYLGLAWAGMMILTSGAYLINLLNFTHYYRISDLFKMIALTSIEMFGFRQFRATCCIRATLLFFWRKILHRFNLSKLAY